MRFSKCNNFKSWGDDASFPHVCPPSELLYTFMEGYTDKESLEYHTTTRHYKENGKAMAEFLDGRPEVEVMNEIAPNK